MKGHIHRFPDPLTLHTADIDADGADDASPPRELKEYSSDPLRDDDLPCVEGLNLLTDDIDPPAGDTPDDDAPPSKKAREHSPDPLRAEQRLAVEKLPLYTADPHADTPDDDAPPPKIRRMEEAAADSVH